MASADGDGSKKLQPTIIKLAIQRETKQPVLYDFDQVEVYCEYWVAVPGDEADFGVACALCGCWCIEAASCSDRPLHVPEVGLRMWKLRPEPF